MYGNCKNIHSSQLTFWAFYFPFSDHFQILSKWCQNWLQSQTRSVFFIITNQNQTSLSIFLHSFSQLINILICENECKDNSVDIQMSLRQVQMFSMLNIIVNFIDWLDIRDSRLKPLNYLLLFF